MPQPKSTSPAKGERRTPPSAKGATDQSPRGSPTEDRHATETAGGQHKHDAPHTSDESAKQ